MDLHNIDEDKVEEQLMINLEIIQNILNKVNES